jgi:hypothetical protein
MTISNRFIVTRAIANIISGISMVTLVTLGISYMQFDNAFVFQDIKIEITNNPVTGEEIEFAMMGSKKHECASTRVYGVAYKDDNKLTLDKFTKQYVRNTRPGENVPNTWSLQKPKDMIPGDWRVSITGEFKCNHLIFQTTKIQTYDNILLIVE